MFVAVIARHRFSAQQCWVGIVALGSAAGCSAGVDDSSRRDGNGSLKGGATRKHTGCERNPRSPLLGNGPSATRSAAEPCASAGQLCMVASAGLRSTGVRATVAESGAVTPRSDVTVSGASSAGVELALNAAHEPWSTPVAAVPSASAPNAARGELARGTALADATNAPLVLQIGKCYSTPPLA